MAPNNPAKELIDERIVRLLGLSYDFELDYQTYIFYLKEKLVEVTSSRKKIPPEEFDLIKNEFKRVKGKTGRFTFKIKKNRINANNVSNLNSFSNKNKKLLSGTQVSKDQTKQSVVGEGILDIVKSIGKTVTSIHKTLLTQSNLSKKEFESDRKNKERSKRGSREDKLEQKENGVVETAKKILAPFQSIFDRIIRFLVFTILGRAFKVFMDWAGDPKNKGKLTTIGKFLKDWWPALLGAWFLFATPLGAFTRTIIGTIAKLSFHLAKFAIPKLIKFAATNPVIAAGAVTGIAAGAGFMMEKNRTDEIAKRQGTTPEKRGQGDFFNEIGKAFNPGQLGMGGVSPMGMSRGGSVFSGIVNKDTGETVSGAGADTQFLPIEGGGGAVLQRGESVLQVGARERMIRQAGVDPLAYNIGSNANKPRSINPRNLIGLNNGGVVGGSPSQINLPLSGSQRKALEVLGKYESGSSGGYNAVNQIGTKGGRGVSGFSGDFRKMKQHKGRSLTDLTLAEIAKLQHDDKTLNDKQWINAGKLHAVGRYQIVGNTLPELVNKLNIPKNTKFSPITQDAMALQLMKERGIQPWIGPSDKATLAERAIIENARKEKINISRSKPTPSQGTPRKPFNFFGAMGKLIGRQNGGLIKPSDGVRNPHSASDPRIGAFDPNEYLISKSGVRKAGGGSFERGAQFFDNLLAILDKNSNPAKQGKYNIEPPSRRNSVVTLPTISNTIGGNMGGNMNATKDRVVPGFSAISSVAQETRFRNAEIYGIG